MDNIGEILKNTRLDKGLSLEQVEEATSIRKIYLAAIETGDYTKIPGDVSSGSNSSFESRKNKSSVCSPLLLFFFTFAR